MWCMGNSALGLLLTLHPANVGSIMVNGTVRGQTTVISGQIIPKQSRLKNGICGADVPSNRKETGSEPSRSHGQL